MRNISTLTNTSIKISGSPEGAAEKIGVSVATISRWRNGTSKPQPNQERKLRSLVKNYEKIHTDSPLENNEQLRGEIENVVRSLLNEFREILHRHSRFSHRNESLEFLCKVLFAHIVDKEHGKRGITKELLHENQLPATTLKSFVERILRANIPGKSTSINQKLFLLDLDDRDNEFAEATIILFSNELADDAINRLIASHQFDLLNNIFGRFVTSSFAEEKELGQYLTPPEVVQLMTDIAINSLDNNLLKDLVKPNSNKIILDPSCGVGSFLVSALHGIAERLDDRSLIASQLQKRLVGFDKSERMIQLAITNLAMLGCTQTKFSIGNSLDRLSSKPINQYAGRAALILTNPPFGASFQNSDIGNYEIMQSTERDRGKIISELLFLERYIEWLCPDGVLLAIVPDSILTNQGAYRAMRKYLAKYCDIISVISLPPVTFGAAGTNTKTSILHLRKRSAKTPKTSTYFGVCNTVGYDVITRGSQRRRVINQHNDLPKVRDDLITLSNPTFGNSIQFQPDSERWDAKYNVSAHEFSSNNSKIISISEIADLVSEKHDPRRSTEAEFNYIEISDVETRYSTVTSKVTSSNAAPSRARKKVRTGDVIMSTVRPERGSVGVIPDHLNGAICSTGFAVFRAKNIHPYDLAFLLKSKYFLAQVERIMSGIAYPAINEKVLPDLVLDAAIVNRLRESGQAKNYQSLVQSLNTAQINMAKMATV